MKSWMHLISIRIKDSRGFSMAETLMTVLLMSISLMAITGGASVIQRSYRTITMKSDAMALISMLTTAINADLRSASEIREDGYFYSGQRNLIMKFTTSDTDKIVISYLKPDGSAGEILVGSEGMYIHDSLTAEFENSKEPSISSTGKYFSYTILVKRKSDKKILESQDISVRIV